MPLVALSANELQLAAAALPIAFVKAGDSWTVNAIMGFPPSTNLCVAPDGRWSGNYVPAAIRAYPFLMVRGKDEQVFLCIDEDFCLLPEGANGADGEAFFNDDGTPAKRVADVMEMLGKYEGGRLALAKACDALGKHGLLVGWPLNVQSGTASKPVGGLLRIDEAALGRLSAEALHELMQVGALGLAYCQLVSMQHMARLADASRQRVQPAAAAAAPAAAAAVQG